MGVGVLPVLDGGVDARLGAVLDAVGADDGGADDRLGDGAEQHADLVAYDGVGGRQLLLEPADREEQRGERQPDHQRELPAVEDHQHGRDQHLADADDEDQAAEDEELADLVDVAGHAGDQCAAALGVLGQQREVVHVAERLGAQRRETALGGGEEPAGHQVGRAARHGDREGGEHPHPDDVVEARTAGAVEPAVEGLLDRDRDDDLAARGDHGVEQGEPEALAQLGRVLHAEAEGRHGADVLAGVHPGPGGGCDSAHDRRPSVGRRIPRRHRAVGVGCS